MGEPPVKYSGIVSHLDLCVGTARDSAKKQDDTSKKKTSDLEYQYFVKSNLKMEIKRMKRCVRSVGSTLILEW